jgi:hypothetical protein
MGCSDEIGLREIDENHKIDIQSESQILNKHSKINFEKNNNNYITKCSNYFQNENKTQKFTESILSIPDFSSQVEKLIQIKKENIEWKSAKEIFGDDVRIFGETTSMNDIILGPADNSFLVSVISSLSNYPSIIIQLFRTLKLPKDDEPIEVCIKIEGIWTIIRLDDKFLVNKENNMPIFSYSPTKNIWGLILEKAYAKICGGYENILIGNPKDVFESLTPFRIIEINLKKFEKELFWKYIKSSLENNCIIICITKNNIKGLDSIGFINNQSFSLLDIQSENNNKIDLIRKIKLRNSLGNKEAFQNGITEEIKNLGIVTFEEDGIFLMQYYNFLDLFSTSIICVPSSTLLNYLIEIPNEKSNDFGTIRLLIEEEAIINISLIIKYREEKMKGDIFKNIILIQLFRNKQKANYINSSSNETLSSLLSPGEYIIIFNVDYKTANIKKSHSYYVNLSSTKNIKYIMDKPDNNLKLLKYVMIQKLQTYEKYKELLKESFIVFTGNKFESTSFAFYFLKNNKKEIKYLKPSVYLRNFKSIEGEFPKSLKMEQNSVFFFLFNRIKPKSAFQTGANVIFFKENVMDAIEPISYNKIPDEYCLKKEFTDNKCNYEFANQEK